jgi:hypothetical protein
MMPLYADSPQADVPLWLVLLAGVGLVAYLWRRCTRAEREASNAQFKLLVATDELAELRGLRDMVTSAWRSYADGLTTEEEFGARMDSATGDRAGGDGLGR